MDNDKISRQALLDEINEEIEYGEEHFRPENEQINKGLKIARKLVRTAPTIEAEPDNGWISVKDRLPPTGIPVLIYVYNIEEMTVVSLDHDGLGFSNADEWFNIKNIHHWQPLPKPPKGE